MCEHVTSTCPRQPFLVSSKYNTSHAFECYLPSGKNVWDTRRHAEKHWLRFRTHHPIPIPSTCQLEITHPTQPCRVGVSVSAMNSHRQDGRWYRVSQEVVQSVPCGSYARLRVDMNDSKLGAFDNISIAFRTVDDDPPIRLRVCAVDWGIPFALYRPLNTPRAIEFLCRCDLPSPALTDACGASITGMGFESPVHRTDGHPPVPIDPLSDDGTVTILCDLGSPYPCASRMVLSTPVGGCADLTAHTPSSICLYASDTGSGWDAIYQETCGSLWASEGEEQRVYTFPPSQTYVTPRFYKLVVGGMPQCSLMLNQFGLAVDGRTTLRAEPVHNHLLYDMSTSDTHAHANLVHEGERLCVPAGDVISVEFNTGDRVRVGALRFVALATSPPSCDSDPHVGRMTVYVRCPDTREWHEICAFMFLSSECEVTVGIPTDSHASSLWRVCIQNTWATPLTVCDLTPLSVQCGGWVERRRGEGNKFMVDMEMVRSILSPSTDAHKQASMPMTMLILTLYSLCRSKDEFMESIQSITEKGIMCSDGSTMGSASQGTTHPLIHWLPSQTQGAHSETTYVTNGTKIEAPRPVPRPVECATDVCPLLPCPDVMPPQGVDALQMRKETPLYQEHNDINKRLTYYDSLLDMEIKSAIPPPPPPCDGLP